VKLLADKGYELIPCERTSDSIIGEGAYSKVQLFYSTSLRKNVAIKIINKSSAPRDFVNHFLPREIEVLQRVRHQFVVEITEILATNDGRIFIVMEYAQHGDLLRHIQQNGAIDEDRSRYLFKQLIKSVQYLHNKRIVHRDLKCENLLLTRMKEDLPKIRNNRSYTELSNNNNNINQTPPESPRRYDMGNMLTPEFNMEEVKLLVTDFGFSRRFESPDEKSRTFCGSAAYAAPEIIKGEPYKMRDHDMWSLGVILFIMVCGTMPYDDSNVRKMLKEQLSRKLRFPPQAAQTLSDECKDLIHKLIEPNANRRYKIDQILSHPWLTQIPNEEIISTPSPIVIQSLGLEENNNSSSNNKSAKKSQSNQKSQHNPTASDQSHQQHQQQGKEQQAKNGNTNNKFWW